MFGFFLFLTKPHDSPTREGPRYVKGNAVSLSLVGMATVLYGFLRFWYDRINKQRDVGDNVAQYEGLSDDELAELGDESPRFRYTI